MCALLSFQEETNKLRCFEIYKGAKTNFILLLTVQLALRMDTTAIYLQARRVDWQKDKLVIRNHSLVLFATS